MKTKLVGMIVLQIIVACFFSIFLCITALAEDGAINPNDKITGVINSTQTKSVYKVVLPEDGKLQFTLVSDPSLNMLLVIYGQDGATQIASNTGGSGQTVNLIRGLMAGTYYVSIIRNWGDGSGAYTLTSSFSAEAKTIDKEDNNSYLNAVAAENNKSITGHLAFTSQNGVVDKADWYKFTVPSDGKFQMVLVSDPSLNIRFCLYGQDGVTLIGSDTGGSGTINLVNGLMTGTYYVSIEKDWGDGFGGYTLNNTFSAEPKAIDQEDNNSYLNAVNMDNNKSITGHLSFISQNVVLDKTDWYKINVSEDGKLQLVLVADPSLNVSLRLYAQDGVTIKEHASGSSGNSINISETLAPGTYYVSVDKDWGDGFGAYTLVNTFTGLTKHNTLVLTVGKPKMKFNSQSKDIDPGRNTSPVVISGRTLVPIKSIIDAMNGRVDWNASDRKITINLGANTIELWLDKKLASINNNQKAIDVAPVSINGRTMVPVRFVTENLNCDVNWNPATKEITIKF
ncbi:MAG: stalk domain-containing protein [Bacillota bacterium]|nr:stalk domain-containing protein [Bacillota bacterium]